MVTITKGYVSGATGQACFGPIAVLGSNGVVYSRLPCVKEGFSVEDEVF